MLCKNSEFSRITEREKQSAAKLHRRRLFGGVDDVIAAGAAEVTGYYNLQGVRADEPRDGLNIVVYGDGSCRKVAL